jgi:hypothetical protein
MASSQNCRGNAKRGELPCAPCGIRRLQPHPSTYTDSGCLVTFTTGTNPGGHGIYDFITVT